MTHTPTTATRHPRTSDRANWEVRSGALAISGRRLTSQSSPRPTGRCDATATATSPLPHTKSAVQSGQLLLSSQLGRPIEGR